MSVSKSIAHLKNKHNHLLINKNIKIDIKSTLKSGRIESLSIELR